MIYCNLKNKTENSAVYSFGTTIEDITGEVEFYTDFTEPSILKQPSTGDVTVNMLNRLVIKYKSKFALGVFPDKLAYER